MHSEWTQAFPEVPPRFHEAVRDTLETLGKTERKRSVKKRIITLAAVVAILGISAAAAVMSGWHEKVAQRFSASESQQEQLGLAGAASLLGQSASGGGVTVTALQTLGDKNGLYILFHIKAPEGITLTEEGSGIGFDVKVDGERVSWNAQFMPDSDKPEGAANEHYFELWINNTKGADLHGKTIKVRFRDLRDLDRGPKDNVVVSGEWELSWPLTYMNEMRRYDLDAAYSVNGSDIAVQSVELSPLSTTLALSGEGLDELIERSDLYEAGGLCALTVIMKDGTRIEEGPKNEFVASGVYTQIIRFSRVYDLDDIAGFTLTFYHEQVDNTVTLTLP